MYENNIIYPKEVLALYIHHIILLSKKKKKKKKGMYLYFFFFTLLLAARQLCVTAPAAFEHAKKNKV